MITREELLKSKEYWLTQIQHELAAEIEEYAAKNCISNEDLAPLLGISARELSRLKAGDFDGKISVMVAMLVIIGKAPAMTLRDTKSPMIKFQDLQKIANDYAT